MANNGNFSNNRCACGSACRKNNRRGVPQNRVGPAVNPLNQRFAGGGNGFDRSIPAPDQEFTGGIPTGDGGIGTANGCGCSIPTPAQELYGVTFQSREIDTCCDPYNGCRQYNRNRRNPFWPSFAHPRWLPCRELYNGDEQD